MGPLVSAAHRDCLRGYIEPVVAVMPFDTEEEAITLANDTDYGLFGSIFTSDVGPDAQAFTDEKNVFIAH